LIQRSNLTYLEGRIFSTAPDPMRWGSHARLALWCIVGLRLVQVQPEFGYLV
jgi:hypothetical protein